MNIIEFVESPYGLGFTRTLCGKELYPVQKFILKVLYNIELDTKTKSIHIPKSWRHAQSVLPEHYIFTEAEYMRYLYNEGRCNIKEMGHTCLESILPLGRRSGKSLLSSIIASYEVYRLLTKENPQRYYGMHEGVEISISLISPNGDSSKLMCDVVRKHFQSCDFFTKCMSHNTSSYIKFQPTNSSSIGTNFFSPLSCKIGLANLTVILDEVAFFNKSSSDAIYHKEVSSVAMFTSEESKEAEGRIILISSPYNKDGLFYNKYEQSKAEEGAKNTIMIQAPTWEVNPYFPIGFLENAHRTLGPVAFEREFGAKFTESILVEKDTHPVEAALV